MIVIIHPILDVRRCKFDGVVVNLLGSYISMKNIFILCLIIVAGYYSYNKLFNASTSEFSLKTIVEKPIPQHVFFELLKEETLKICATNSNPTPEECRNIVAERHQNCERTASVGAPKIIGSTKVANHLGKKYLECASPYPVCNGVEVRTEEEARKYCK